MHLNYLSNVKLQVFIYFDFLTFILLIIALFWINHKNTILERVVWELDSIIVQFLLSKYKKELMVFTTCSSLGHVRSQFFTVTWKLVCGVILILHKTLLKKDRFQITVFIVFELQRYLDNTKLYVGGI